MSKIINANVYPDGSGVEITYREASNMMYLCNPPRPCPDTVWKEVWKVEDGKLVKKEDIPGQHIPSSINEEQIIF